MMKAKEAAEMLLRLTQIEREEPLRIYDEEAAELILGAAIVARHVVASTKVDDQLLRPIPVETVEALGLQHRRYLLLLELIDADDPEARTVLEKSLDATIASRDQLVVRADQIPGGVN